MGHDIGENPYLVIQKDKMNELCDHRNKSVLLIVTSLIHFVLEGGLGHAVFEGTMGIIVF